jgi:hypothetical protein
MVFARLWLVERWRSGEICPQRVRLGTASPIARTDEADDLVRPKWAIGSICLDIPCIPERSMRFTLQFDLIDGR